MRLVGLYGAIPAGSPAAGPGRPRLRPRDDILGGRARSVPDLGAYEAGGRGHGDRADLGPSSGGTGIAVTGAGFAAGASVAVGGADATGVSVSSAAS